MSFIIAPEGVLKDVIISALLVMPFNQRHCSGPKQVLIRVGQNLEQLGSNAHNHCHIIEETT